MRTVQILKKAYSQRCQKLNETKIEQIPRKITSGYITIKMLKTKDKEQIVKAA